jgi:hypothetical protein
MPLYKCDMRLFLKEAVNEFVSFRLTSVFLRIRNSNNRRIGIFTPKQHCT